MFPVMTPDAHAPILVSAIPLAHECRGGRPETTHLGWWVLANADGPTRIASHPDAPAVMTYARSCAKPWQAVPLVQSGVASQWSAERLAIACGSHVGSPEHVALVDDLLAEGPFDLEALGCGAQAPVSAHARHELLRSGLVPDRRHNNCSGKHVAMLHACKAFGFDPTRYWLAEHPLQQRITAWVKDQLGRPVAVAVDGCGVPTYWLTLGEIAQMYARMAVLPETTPLLDAMAQAPEAMGGAERVDSTIIRLTEGALIAKVGASGIVAVTHRKKQQGLVLKLADGLDSVRNRALVQVLMQLGWLSPVALTHPALAPWRDPTIRNTQGVVTGQWVMV